MNKNGFLSIFLVFSLFLPVAVSFIQTVDDHSICYESCQENQTEEQESEENYNEIEAFLLDQEYTIYFSCSKIFEASSNKALYINVNREILTPPPQRV